MPRRRAGRRGGGIGALARFSPVRFPECTAIYAIPAGFANAEIGNLASALPGQVTYRVQNKTGGTRAVTQAPKAADRTDWSVIRKAAV